MIYYVLDPYYLEHYYKDGPYVKNHGEFCRVVTSERAWDEVYDICSAIWLYFREIAGEHCVPDLDDALLVLRDCFGFGIPDMSVLTDEVQAVLDKAEDDVNDGDEFIAGEHTYCYIDLHANWEYYDDGEALYGKFLSDECARALVAKCRAVTSVR